MAPFDLQTLSASSEPFIALAPMDGVTDAITRDLLTEENRSEGTNAVSLCASEFVRVTQEAVSHKVLLREVPELRDGGCTRSGVPVFVQLLGGQAAPLAESARRAAELGARGVDLNFGCPAKTVNRHDGGATLLKYPDRMVAITAAVRDALPPEIPLSVKIRTGWERGDDVVHLALAAERGGANFLTIHGRTRMDLYKPAADMAAIARARQAVKLPVIANGDLFSPQAFLRAEALSGCTAFMIGRGAMAHPNLFLQVRQGHPVYDEGRMIEFLMRFADRLVAAGVEDSRALGRLKNWLCLGSRVEPRLAPLFDRCKRAGSLRALASAMEGPTRSAGGVLAPE